MSPYLRVIAWRKRSSPIAVLPRLYDKRDTGGDSRKLTPRDPNCNGWTEPRGLQVRALCLLPCPHAPEVRRLRLVPEKRHPGQRTRCFLRNRSLTVPNCSTGTRCFRQRKRPSECVYRCPCARPFLARLTLLNLQALPADHSKLKEELDRIKADKLRRKLEREQQQTASGSTY